MKTVVLYILAAYFFLTGLFILLAPKTFYRVTPGLAAMGPYNHHFIIDAALVFLVSGGALFYGVRAENRPVLVVAAMWPFLHSLFHLWVWAHRGLPFDLIWISDTLGVIVPGIIALWLALSFRPTKPERVS